MSPRTRIRTSPARQTGYFELDLGRNLNGFERQKCVEHCIFRLETSTLRALFDAKSTNIDPDARRTWLDRDRELTPLLRIGLAVQAHIALAANRSKRHCRMHL